MTGLRLTDRQARATQPGAHIWVDASAGTGKSHVLTARVLRLMVDGARPDSILCLTYTKAAAGEMVGRILTQLGRWAVADAPALKRDLAVLLGGSSQVQDSHLKRAQALFLDVLDLPGGLAIQTLHAFSQSLLGRFPLESATAPSFETIDERTAKEYAAEARDKVLALALEGGDADLAKAASTLARLLADGSFDSVIAELLAMRGALTDLPAGLLALRQTVHEALGAPLGQRQEDILKQACMQATPDLGAAANHLIHSGSKTDQTRGATIQDWLQSKTREGEFDVYCLAFLTAGFKAARKQLITKPAEKARPGTADILAQEAQRLLGVRESLALKRLAEESALAIAFGQALLKHYSARKMQAGTLDFADLIDRTEALLAGQVPPEWVLYRLDSQIEHILIDEAQDNSSLQWKIVEQLSSEFFSGEGQHARTRSVFAVGDMKQSIYGFQGAEPKLFNDSKISFQAKAEESDQAFEDVGLNKSFRSVDTVLRVVDETFVGAAGTGLDAQRVSIKHDTHRTGMGGMVDLWPLTLPEEREDDTAAGWRLPLVERAEKKPDRLLAERIAEDIHQRIAAGECLPGRANPLTAGDFLILARRRSDLMGYIARALKKRGVPIAGLDRFDLKSPMAVRDLVNLARFATLPNDDFALACVLKSPLCNVSEETLMALCAGREGSLWAAAKTSPSIPQEATALLHRVLAMADYAPPFELFSHVLEAGGRMRLQERLGGEAEDAINVFLGQCLAYERSHTASLDGFLHWFLQSDVEVKRDPEAAGDKVRIMTIHGAKGLQAPVVYLADLASKPTSKSPFVHVPSGGSTVPILRRHAGNDIGPIRTAFEAAEEEAYQEYKRLLYVAMTRAEDQLICCGYASKAREAPADLEAKPDGYDLITAAFDRLDISPDADGLRRYSTPQRAALSEAAPLQDKQALYSLPDWARSKPPPEESPPRPLQPSDTGLSNMAPFKAAQISQTSLSPAKRGTLIHALLEHLPTQPQSDWRDVGMAYLEATVPQELAEELLAEALATLGLPEMHALLGEGSRAEVPIIARLGDFVVSGQVDRLAITDDAVLFADFKTTQSPPEDAPPDILRQMALYALSLEEVFPTRTVRGAILWTATGRVDWPSRETLMAHLPSTVHAP
ncbi:MAG: double-strand break repair helicase AddA [Sphingomonadales bacterium]